MYQQILDAATAFKLGNATMPPTQNDMLQRNPDWDQDVFTVLSLINFQLSKYEPDE